MNQEDLQQTKSLVERLGSLQVESTLQGCESSGDRSSLSDAAEQAKPSCEERVRTPRSVVKAGKAVISASVQDRDKKPPRFQRIVSAQGSATHKRLAETKGSASLATTREVAPTCKSKASDIAPNISTSVRPGSALKKSAPFCKGKPSSSASNYSSLRPSSALKPISSSQVCNSGPKRSSQALKEVGARRREVFNKAGARGHKGMDDVVDSRAASFPDDILVKIFGSLDSVFDIVACGQACRTWRRVLLEEDVWRILSQRWMPMSEAGTSAVPNWRDYFVANFSAVRRRILDGERQSAVQLNYIRAGDFVPRGAFTNLIKRLGISFQFSLNPGHSVTFGPRTMNMFALSTTLVYPSRLLKPSLTLGSIRTLEVTVKSAKLQCVRRLLTLSDPANDYSGLTPLDGSESGEGSPVQLRQLRNGLGGGSLVIGTLAAGSGKGEEAGSRGEDHVVLLVLTLPWLDVLQTLFVFNVPLSPLSAEDDHGVFVAIELRSFSQSFWHGVFTSASCNPRARNSSSTRTFSLVPSSPTAVLPAFPEIFSLPWATGVFSGELSGGFIADVAVWSSQGSLSWRTSAAVHAVPATDLRLEYGPVGRELDDGVRLFAELCEDDPKLQLNIFTPTRTRRRREEDHEENVILSVELMA